MMRNQKPILYLPINLPSMSYIQYCDYAKGIGAFVDDTVISYPDSLAFSPCQFLASGRPGIVRQTTNGASDTIKIRGGEPA